MTGDPMPTACVFVCMGCHHWQVDAPPRAVRELGGVNGFAMAMAEAHVEYHDCPGDGGRIKVHGQWVDQPTMASGRPATATLGAFALPRWWVWR